MTNQSAHFRDQFSKILCCPVCLGDLALGDDLVCRQCEKHFGVENDIPLLFWPNEWGAEQADVTEVVKAFYEETPFPNYDDCDSVGSLLEKAERSVFVKLLNEQIPMGTRILEAGCGTGQLTNCLGTFNRTVIGTDICLNSLRLGNNFKKQNQVKGSHFVQMNLFRPVFKPSSFDLVYSTGVLHHTADPRKGFESIAKLVRPKGYIVLGLYHMFGRLLNDFRRMLFRIAGEQWKTLDPQLREQSGLGMSQRRAWFADQYQHPHESKHTISEVMTWFEQAGFSFVRSIPTTQPFISFRGNESLFSAEPPGGPIARRLVEAGMAVTSSREGGYFIIIGRKRAGDGS